ncbi:hypothetical protein [Longispora albida]|nr:hypothetical protein [Longispora albida]
MGRGARGKVRWTKDRILKKKERDKRAAETRAADRAGSKKK